VREWFGRSNALPGDRNPSGPGAIADHLDLAAQRRTSAFARGSSASSTMPYLKAALLE
jgi:hypothetical protein